MKFSKQVAKTLKKLGFTHFFLVGGGNIMHLTGALAEELTPVPVIHEVAAIIGSEYFNKANKLTSPSRWSPLALDLQTA